VPSREPVGEAFEHVVEAVGKVADLPTDVLEQPDALLAHRRPHLGCLGDSLDELLRLVACQHPLPDAVHELRVERLDDGSLQPRACPRPLERLHQGRALEYAEQRPLQPPRS
jgi:hypothetical protein